MGDWADDLADDWVRRIRAGEMDEPALAMKLRNIEVTAALDAVTDLGQRLRYVLDDSKNNVGRK